MQDLSLLGSSPRRSTIFGEMQVTRLWGILPTGLPPAVVAKFAIICPDLFDAECKAARAVRFSTGAYGVQVSAASPTLDASVAGRTPRLSSVGTTGSSPVGISNIALVVESADTLRSDRSATAYRFNSCRGHQFRWWSKAKPSRPVTVNHRLVSASLTDHPKHHAVARIARHAPAKRSHAGATPVGVSTSSGRGSEVDHVPWEHANAGSSPAA